jgi:ABC-2 type transport system ATP-binding protein/ribosome-dependent ATPase
MSTAGPLLAAHGVTRRFGSFAAVQDVTIRVHAGEVVGLLGANGAGKTTLIRLLLGLLATTSGTVEVLGGPPDRRRRSLLGYVPQGLGLYGDLTVRENLAFITHAYATTVPDLPPALAADGDALVADLPLGLQRRLSFAAALAHAPQALVLDEPTSGVDVVAAAALWDTVRAQAGAGVGVLVTTHTMAEAAQCDRLLLMARGRLVAQGSESDIVGGTRAFQVRTADWAAAFAALDAAGEPVMLAGRDVRVADSDPQTLFRVLAAAGLQAQVVEVPATIEERMRVLARAEPGAEA